ncbi:ATP-binding protein [Algoriphagus sp.]|jgi:signal transduction histidine kinase|uniref:ATP-binding protein n=1 Tax=Algoriphagus sp. TaxID=1872435 RepID=UPI002720F34B|nr:ATP-binding protein [Algoriphagus sp.]MDO8968969.1 ATP-binding protein [Algoriphagus sp.]MDP3202123.1 ATP-binding protein [Algoriphagus sp.]
MQKNLLVTAFLVVLIFSLGSFAFAQINISKGIPTITNYTSKEFKYAGQQIWSLGQDEKGFIFIGTNQGLIKFDGTDTELLISPLKGFNTSVRSLHKSKSGVLYYGSLGDFGYVGEDKVGKSIQVSLSKLIPEDFLINDIWSISELDDKIYFQAREGILIYTPASGNQVGKVEIWKPDTQFMYAFSVGGRFYAHQIDLGLYQAKKGVLELIPGSEFLGGDRVQVLLPFRSPEEFLVAGFSGGFFHYDGKDFKPFKTELDEYLIGKRLYKGIMLSSDKYALGIVGGGLVQMDSQGKLLSNLTTKNSLVDDSVYSLLLDTTGTLWAGTNNGISKIEISSPLTRFLSEDYEIGSLLSLKKLKDKLYIGGSTTVLYLDDADGKIKKVDGIPNAQVFDLQLDGDQLLSSNVGIYTIQNGTAKQIPGTEKLQIIRILISEKHPGYVFTSGSFGIFVFKRTKPLGSDTYKFEQVGLLNQIERYIYTLEEDGEGELWAGTQAGNLFHISWAKTASGNLDLPSTKVQQFTDSDGIPGLAGRVSKVQDRIYTSGIQGFYYFDKKSNAFVRDSVFSFSNEVANINIDNYALQTDELGRVFIVFKDERKLAVPQSDGTYILQDYPINLFTGNTTSSIYSEPDGVLWLGTDEGLIRISNEKSLLTEVPFPVYFSRIIASSDTLRHSSQAEGAEIHEMEFKNNSIRFAYTAPFFIQEKLTKYQTYLEGFDQDWGKWEETNFREFTNLPHGDYTFRVRAKNIYNIVSDEITYKFVILPPWYATWWAYLFYFLGLGLLVFGLVKFQSGRLVAIEKERARQKELEHAHEIEEAYQNLKSTQEQLLQQEKLASLGQLTAGIAHEIKNPLNFVNNFADLSIELIDEMRDELENDNKTEALSISEDIKSNLLKIHQHGTRADSIVKSMLLHSRGGSGKMEPTDLNAMIQEFSNLAFHGMRASKNPINVGIELKLDESIVKIPLYTDDFSRVILNLCNNAFDAMREKIEIEENSTKKYTPELIIVTKSLKDGVELIFNDNGPGIPEEIQDKILQPFFTTKKGTEGTGLGLSITHDIVKRHSGNLTIHSQIGVGTQFTIFLPNQNP